MCSVHGRMPRNASEPSCCSAVSPGYYTSIRNMKNVILRQKQRKQVGESSCTCRRLPTFQRYLLPPIMKDTSHLP